MRHVLTAAVVLIASVAMADMPTTQPTPYPALQKKLADLAARVKELEDQNAKLLKENTELKSRVAAIAKTPAAGPSLPRDDLEIGMTIDDVGKVLKGPRTLRTRSTSGASYSWAKDSQFTEKYEVIFDNDGKLVSFSKQ